MQIPQLTFNTFPAAAFTGQLADLSPKDVASAVVDVALDCGKGVVYGAAYGRVTLPSSAGNITDHFQGFVLYQAIKEPQGPIGAPTANRYKITDSVNVLRKGRIWILCNGDTVDDSPCYIVHTDADPVQVGLVRADLNTNKAALAPRTKIIKGALAGQLALVEVNLV